MDIYCDGASIPNPGKMGIGVYIPEKELELSWYVGEGTNQRAELRALIEALKLSSDGDRIFTDSKYALGIAGKWKPQVNKDLASELKRLAFDKWNVKLRWIKGHAGIQKQEKADSLANEAVYQQSAD